MRLAPFVPAIRVRIPPRRAALACLLVASLALGATILPPLLGAAPTATARDTISPEFMAGLAALLGLLAGVLGLFAGRGHGGAGLPDQAWADKTRADAATTSEATAAETTAALAAALHKTFQEARGLLAAERGELASFREQCASATHEAMLVGARLAGAAIDAETRLAAGIAQVEQALRQPGEAFARAAEAAQVVERVLPDLAELLKGGAAAARAGAAAGAAEGAMSPGAHSPAEIAADNMVTSFRAALTDAVDQMAALGDAAVALRRDVVALDTAGREIATMGAAAVSRASEAVGQVDAALSRLPAAAAAVTAATEQAARTLAEASAALCADGVALHASGGEIARVATGLRHEAAALRAAGQEITAANAEAEATRRDAAEREAAGINACVVTLEAAAATVAAGTARLAHGVESLEAAGQRAAEAGAGAAVRLEAEAERAQAALRPLHALPETAAEVLAAAASLRSETSALTAAAARITTATAEAAAGAATAAVALDTTGRLVRAAGDEVALQIDRLGGIAMHVETQASLLPDAAARLADLTAPRLADLTAPRLADLAAERLNSLAAERLADLAERVRAADAAAPPVLDHLDTLSLRLESLVARLSAVDGPAQAEIQETALASSLATLSGLSAEIGAALGRVEAALGQHDGAGQALLGAMEQVRAAMGAVDQAARARDARGDNRPLDLDGTPPALTATLYHLDGVACQTETLLRETEALAEAVLAGRAPGLPPQLADRAPSLLAGVEATIRRLRSVATALALASDGLAAAPAPSEMPGGMPGAPATDDETPLIPRRRRVA